MNPSAPAPLTETANGHKPARASQLLTAEDVADRWKVPKSHVWRLARERGLPCVKLGKYRRFSISAIEDFEAAGGTG